MFRLHDVYFSFGHMDFDALCLPEVLFRNKRHIGGIIVFRVQNFKPGVANIIGLKGSL